MNMYFPFLGHAGCLGNIATFALCLLESGEGLRSAGGGPCQSHIGEDSICRAVHTRLVTLYVLNYAT